MDKAEIEDFLSKLFCEEDFFEKLNTVVKPFLEQYAQEGYFKSYDGKEIHYYQCINPQEKASIVILHGFCEFFQKYQEVVYELFQMGYSIFFIEHRGHGKSYRDVPEQPDLVYIDSYDQYIEDLKSFMDQIVLKQSRTNICFVFAHSMGGCIGSLFLEKYPSYFKAAVLSSPMMQMNVGKVPPFLVKIMMGFVKIFNKGKKYAPGQNAFDGVYIFNRSSALSEPRYKLAFQMREKFPEYRTYGSSCAWTRASINAAKKARKNAASIKIPVLLFQAGRDQMVIPKGQDIFISKIDGAKKIIFPDSKHEIYNATEDIRKEYYRAIMHFYDDNSR